MKFFVLSTPISISGRTMLGLGKASVILAPPEHLNGFDPLFVSCAGEAPRRLGIGAAKVRSRRITIEGSQGDIAAIEHYASLRFLFPGMHIIHGVGQAPPYIACAGSLLPSLFRMSREIDIKVPWFTARSASAWHYPNLRDGSKAFTAIEPNFQKELVIRVSVSFKGLGKRTEEYVFPDAKLLEEVLSAPAPGIPPWLEWPAKMLWAHGRDVFWSKASEPEEALHMIVRHRVHDILGALSLISPPVVGGFPSLTIRSCCSGHLADVNVLRCLQTVPLS